MVLKWNLTARSLRTGFRQDPSDEDPEQFGPVNFGAVYSCDSIYPNTAEIRTGCLALLLPCAEYWWRCLDLLSLLLLSLSL